MIGIICILLRRPKKLTLMPCHPIGPNHFFQVQIRLFWNIFKFNLNLSKMTWIPPKRNDLDCPNCPKPFGPIEGQGNRQQIKLPLTNWQYPLINYLAMEATGQRKVGITELLPIGVSHVPQEGQIVMLQVNRGLKLDLGKDIHPKYSLQMSTWKNWLLSSHLGRWKIDWF